MSYGGLPTSVEMDYSMVSGVRQASGDGSSRGYRQRSSEAGAYSYSRSGGGQGKGSRSSKSRANHDQDDGEDDEGAEYPNYIPSSSSRAKARASNSSDYACWFFKLDPVKYADCMHVHGRSSDLKYAHLKHHFKDNTIPPGQFDKNMGWDEVWATLFPRIRPPNNKYYVINDMIMSVLESSSVDGDDVTRFIDSIGNQDTREAVLNRIYSLSGDRASPPGSSAGNRRNRQNLQLPSFERTPRTVDTGFTPPSSSSSSSNTTPATSSRPSRAYAPSFGAYAHHGGGLDLDIDSAMGTDYTFSDAVGGISPASPAVGDIAIYDETFTNPLWIGHELPWPGLVDFTSFYLSHVCTKGRHEGQIHIDSFLELQNQYAWHEGNQSDGSCPFTLCAQRRG
ncbi:hypothetical protein TWF481_009299 [Arthrobotrys musiformis]|uniref:Uncharacterized protein n=1 Tax=Arthrobotrys musiformis TaxID=47236 RepID=A0AAV9W3E7_9PEZI